MIITLFYRFSVINIDWRYQVWKAGVTITDNVRSNYELNGKRCTVFE